MANHAEVIHLVNERRLFGLGIGYIDAHLLASLQLTEGSTLWTRDQRLLEIARKLNVPVLLPTALVYRRGDIGMPPQ